MFPPAHRPSSAPRTCANKPITITKERLNERALKYLERYAASREGVATVLKRGLMRDKIRGNVVPSEASHWIDEILDRLCQSNIIDDHAFAQAKLSSLRRAGRSRQHIRQKLLQKGVKSEIADHLLNEDEQSDAQAALIFAKRKKLGPFCTKTERETLREKHTAALARAGFSLQLARMIINAKDEHDAEEKIFS